MKSIYLDNNATTRVAPEVFEAMLPYLTEYYGNPSSLHRAGSRAAGAIKEAREKAAAFLHCREQEVTFTGGGTESNNAAIRGVLEAEPDKRHIITSTTEHPSVLELCKHLEKKRYRVTYIDVDEAGQLNLEKLAESLTEDTAIVSLMWGNNETGVVFPIDDIVQIVKPHGIPLHVDAVQAAGKIPIDTRMTEVDLLAVSGHKLHAPKGVGLLYVRRGTRLRPFIIGGGQEKGRRSGTENVAGVVGLGKAFELAESYLTSGVETTRRLRNRLESGILSKIPNASRNGVPELRLPNTSSLNFENVEGEAVLLLLDEIGICASSGSACTTGAVEPSHVLKAMRVPPERAHGSIRFSLSRYTMLDEVECVLKELPPIIIRLSRLSATG
ncbi:MAG: cysteine desulfurase NifS [Candidatus Krumholzibacteria bacterium]|nr:cysteine desulfurase NifS [Candidatus Krumholzibacteria bacterium]